MNSPPIFESFARGLKKFRHEVVYNSGDGDVAVIWSVLWYGRMRFNKAVFDSYRAQNKPVVVLEIGGLKRDITWKIGVNGINAGHYFVQGPKDSTRRKKLGIELQPWKNNDGKIIICSQHAHSQQWAGQPDPITWTKNIIEEVRKYTDRNIVLRQHPRFKFAVSGVEVDDSKPFQQELLDAYCVINHNSNPGIESVIAGVPAIVDRSSLAAPVSATDISLIENLPRLDREQWANDICWCEWTEDEMREGIPQSLLSPYLQLSTIIGS